MSNENGDDTEAALLYSFGEEYPQLRWGYIRNVYAILAAQLIATIAVAAFVANVKSVALFFGTNWAGWLLYALIIIAVLIVMALIYVNLDKYPTNFILLAIFTLLIGLIFGLVASFISAMVVIEAAAATLAVLACLTLYTFWAARRGEDYSFLVPFLITVVVTLGLLVIFQIFFPLGKISTMVWNGIFILLLCSHIIIDGYSLFERMYGYYILSSIMLYLDIPLMFLKLLGLLKAVVCRN
ncbi:protein LIFEGUARD 3-like [Salvia hispanica]|uniref:protein LIFEGUARD 3-like n=1 Tax=Salvia hispanica TaxID=49212 RepID=UPI002009CE40|nr:protein LIFEGUARD 3-like [Salvia hispanica]